MSKRQIAKRHGKHEYFNALSNLKLGRMHSTSTDENSQTLYRGTGVPAELVRTSPPLIFLAAQTTRQSSYSLP